jgi:hypothetical protein
MVSSSIADSWDGNGRPMWGVLRRPWLFFFFFVPRCCDLFVLAVFGAEVALFYEWLSTANSPWLQLASVIFECVIGVSVLLLFCCIVVFLVGLLLVAFFCVPSASFCFIIIGHSSVGVWSSLSGIACHAALWITLVMFSTASSMSISVFRGIVRVICSSRVFLKQFQSVFFLYNDGFLDLPSMFVNSYQDRGMIWR